MVKFRKPQHLFIAVTGFIHLFLYWFHVNDEHSYFIGMIYLILGVFTLYFWFRLYITDSVLVDIDKHVVVVGKSSCTFEQLDYNDKNICASGEVIATKFEFGRGSFGEMVYLLKK